MKSSTNLALTTPTRISEDYFGGYHRCCLEKPYYMDYASQDLCSMLGYSTYEIHTVFHDKYSQMIFEKDRPKFLEFVNKLASREQTLTLQYRMVCKDGHIIFVQDTTTSRRLEDERMYGFTVISDVSGTPAETPRFSSNFNDLTKRLFDSYGFLQCTCEEYPKITRINKTLQDLIAVSDANPNWKSFLQSNIYFMIPLEERDYFKSRLDKSQREGKPVHLQHNIYRNNGSRIFLKGWLNVVENRSGENEFAIFYTNLEDAQEKLENPRENSYLRALESAYNLIFEINLKNQTVECIHGRDSSAIGALSDIDMTLESAKKFWLNNYILKEDVDMMSSYLEKVTTPNGQWNASNVLQIEFRIRWIDNVVKRFLGVSVKLDESTVLLCCRNITKLQYPAHGQESVVEDPEAPVFPDTEPLKEDIFVRTFGHFDLFVNNIAVTFSSNKEKELLALLIDRNGGTLSATEAIGYLWEDAENTKQVANRYRKLAMGLKNTLEKYHIGHILINNHGVRSINTAALTCDYYELLSGSQQYQNTFHNAYMTDYSWAEDTLATLWDYS
jgi:hypothetical protein